MQKIKTVEPQTFKVAYSFAAVPARYALERKRWDEQGMAVGNGLRGLMALSAQKGKNMFEHLSLRGYEHRSQAKHGAFMNIVQVEK
jgi:hypothetical protein